VVLSSEWILNPVRFLINTHPDEDQRTDAQYGEYETREYTSADHPFDGCEHQEQENRDDEGKDQWREEKCLDEGDVEGKRPDMRIIAQSDEQAIPGQ
jgi:hypothetical protein